MKLKLPLHIGLFICVFASNQSAWGQKSFTDTLSQESMDKFASLATVKNNELFFDALKAKSRNDPKHAVELLEQFVAVEKNNAAAFFELSKLYEEFKKTEKAEEAARKATALVKDNKWYNEHLSIILATEGKFDEAATLMGALADKETSDVNYAVMAADFYDKAKKFTESVAYIDKALLRSGDDDDIQLRKAQLYLHNNQVDKAADGIQKLIRKDQQNGKYYKLLGEIYENNKMPEKALKVYLEAEKVLADDPLIQIGISEHYYNQGDTVNYRKYVKKAIVNNRLEADMQLELLGSYLQNMGDSQQIAEALPVLTQLLVQHPQNAQLIGMYGEFLEMDHKVELAITQYRKALQLKPSNFNIWRDLLNAYSDKKYADSLVKYSEKAMRLFPTQSIVHYYNGIGHYNRKEFPAAIKAVNRAIEMLPDNDTRMRTAMYSLLGDLYNSSKQFEESEKAFDKALELDPNDASVLNNYAYYLSERNRKLDKAEEMSKKSLVLRPGEATFMDTYGWILYKKGDYEKARQNVEQAVKTNDKRADGTLYDHLGDIAFKQNNTAKAVEYWKTAKEKGCENPMLDKKISEGKLYE